MILISTGKLVPETSHVLILIFTLELLLDVEYPYIQPGYKIQIQAPILPITRYFETSPNDSP